MAKTVMEAIDNRIDELLVQAPQLDNFTLKMKFKQWAALFKGLNFELQKLD